MNTMANACVLANEECLQEALGRLSSANRPLAPAPAAAPADAGIRLLLFHLPAKPFNVWLVPFLAI